jgi:hypothetical protein
MSVEELEYVKRALDAERTARGTAGDWNPEKGGSPPWPVIGKSEPIDRTR